MRTFEDFFGDENDAIAQMATLLHEAQTTLSEQKISKSEFDEIAANILDFVNIDQLTLTVEKKVFIKDTIEVLKTIASNLPI